MKIILLALTLCLLLSITQSCTKDSPSAPVTDTLVISHTDTLYITQPTSIYGLWIGTYDITAGPLVGVNDLYYSYELHKDHTIQTISEGADGLTYYGSGTWSINGDEFSAQYTTVNLGQTGNSSIITGTYDSTNNKLTGVITVANSSQFQANFDLEKVE